MKKIGMKIFRSWNMIFAKGNAITCALLLVMFFSFCTNRTNNNNSTNKKEEVKTPPVEIGLAGISTEALKEHVEIISDDKMEGRKAGSEGASKAADYIATCLKDMGIAPYEESYFQYFGISEEFAESGKHNMRNVLGKIEGINKDEFIIVGAHYDHIGIRGKPTDDDRICNGADDNASGVSAVLQIAKAFSDTGETPPRTIIFAFWDAEEMRMLGSKYFVASFNEISRVKAYLNLDMIGRNEEGTESRVVFIYSDTTTNYKQLFEDEFEKYGLNMDLVTDGEIINRDFTGNINIHYSNAVAKSQTFFRRNSDHAPFEDKGVPIFVYTTGFHPDYHKTTDHAEKISWEKLTMITKMSFLTTYQLAHAETGKMDDNN